MARSRSRHDKVPLKDCGLTPAELARFETRPEDVRGVVGASNYNCSVDARLQLPVLHSDTKSVVAGLEHPLAWNSVGGVGG